MPLTPQQFTTLRRAFGDVCRGYSVARYQGNPLYVRHLGHSAHHSYEETQEQFRQEAISKGAMAESDRLTYLISKGLWSEEKEAEIARQRDTLTRFGEGRRSIPIPSMARRHEEQTQEHRAALNRLLGARAEAMGITAEVYSHQRLNDHYIVTNVYGDSALTRHLFDEATFEDLSDSEIQGVVDVYNAATEPCSDTNLRLLSVQDFFVSYYMLVGDSAADFFGRPISEMTYYQVRLLNNARYYRGLAENMDTSRLSPDQRHDPEALEQAAVTQRNQSQMAAEGRVPNVGLTAEDRRALGQTTQFASVPKVSTDFAGLIAHTRATQGPSSVS